MQLSGIPLLDISSTHPPCTGCALGKMPEHSFLGSDKWASLPLTLVHTNLVGPMPVELCSHTCYILTFVDNYMGYALLAFLQVKLDMKKHFQNMVS